MVMVFYLTPIVSERHCLMNKNIESMSTCLMQFALSISNVFFLLIAVVLLLYMEQPIHRRIAFVSTAVVISITHAVLIPQIAGHIDNADHANVPNTFQRSIVMLFDWICLGLSLFVIFHEAALTIIEECLRERRKERMTELVGDCMEEHGVVVHICETST